MQTRARLTAALPVGRMAWLDVERLAAFQTVKQWSRPNRRTNKRGGEMRMLKGVARAAKNHDVRRIIAKFRMIGVRFDVVTVQIVHCAALLALALFRHARRYSSSRAAGSWAYSTLPIRVPLALLTGGFARLRAEASTAFARCAEAHNLKRVATHLAAHLSTKAWFSRPHFSIAGHRTCWWPPTHFAQVTLELLPANRAGEYSDGSAFGAEGFRVLTGHPFRRHGLPLLSQSSALCHGNCG